MSLTTKMKCEIVNYCVEFSKGVIEDCDACPETTKAVDAETTTSDEIEDFTVRCKAFLLAAILNPSAFQHDALAKFAREIQ